MMKNHALHQHSKRSSQTFCVNGDDEQRWMQHTHTHCGCVGVTKINRLCAEVSWIGWWMFRALVTTTDRPSDRPARVDYTFCFPWMDSQTDWCQWRARQSSDSLGSTWLTYGGAPPPPEKERQEREITKWVLLIYSSAFLCVHSHLMTMWTSSRLFINEIYWKKKEFCLFISFFFNRMLMWAADFLFFLIFFITKNSHFAITNQHNV